jgi:excisionase family DNA binding protein
MINTNDSTPIEISRREAIPDFENLLDCEETARLLHLHPKTVERLARECRIPAYKIGKRWLFRASEIDQWMSSLVDFSRRSVPRG